LYNLNSEIYTKFGGGGMGTPHGFRAGSHSGGYGFSPAAGRGSCGTGGYGGYNTYGNYSGYATKKR
jgi:hypothetical protein